MSVCSVKSVVKNKETSENHNLIKKRVAFNNRCIENNCGTPDTIAYE